MATEEAKFPPTELSGKGSEITVSICFEVENRRLFQHRNQGKGREVGMERR